MKVKNDMREKARRGEACNLKFNYSYWISRAYRINEESIWVHVVLVLWNNVAMNESWMMREIQFNKSEIGRIQNILASMWLLHLAPLTLNHSRKLKFTVSE